MEIMHQPFNELSMDWFGWENLDRKPCVIFAPNIEICKFEQCGKPYARNNYIPFEDGLPLIYCEIGHGLWMGLPHYASSTPQIPGKIMITYDNCNPLANLQTNPTVQGDERVVFSGSQKERRWDLMWLRLLRCEVRCGYDRARPYWQTVRRIQTVCGLDKGQFAQSCFRRLAAVRHHVWMFGLEDIQDIQLSCSGSAQDQSPMWVSGHDLLENHQLLSCLEFQVFNLDLYFHPHSNWWISRLLLA